MKLLAAYGTQNSKFLYLKSFKRLMEKKWINKAKWKKKFKWLIVNFLLEGTNKAELM